MKKTLSALAVASLALFATQAVVAQEKSRAEVKKETAEANKAGQIPGAGANANAAGETSPKEKAATSTTTRADRKKTTAEANKEGEIPGAGKSADTAGTMSPKEKAATSTTTREERKKVTAEANKAGDIKSGEANIPAKQK